VLDACVGRAQGPAEEFVLLEMVLEQWACDLEERRVVGRPADRFAERGELQVDVVDEFELRRA
jgi:hypothetical protein